MSEDNNKDQEMRREEEILLHPMERAAKIREALKVYEVIRLHSRTPPPHISILVIIDQVFYPNSSVFKDYRAWTSCTHQLLI